MGVILLLQHVKAYLLVAMCTSRDIKLCNDYVSAVNVVDDLLRDIEDEYYDISLSKQRYFNAMNKYKGLIMKDEKEVSLEKMCKCGVNPAEPLHECPYQADVNNDPDSLCDCCEVCTQQCADDI